MSLCQISVEQPTWPAWYARAKAELLARRHGVMDALFVFVLVILPMVAFIAILFLLSSAEPTTAAVDATAMLILPP
jgi:hypothetical protein